ncbi:MAG: fibronectin type III domain-containing protein, partial [Candidatus Cloacimonetes bacterium]|nr:fibronectin type III domain-containing protein [Candidatus Cloacimonadota bacterium]
MKRKFHFIIIMAILLISCSEQPEFNNLFDPGTNLNPMAGQLQLTQLTDSQVRLQWQQNNDIVGNYLIERKINSGNYDVIANVSANTYQYIDTELLTTNTYYYSVSGVNGENETDPISNSIQTVFAPITNFQAVQQNLTTSYLTWQHNCDYESGYILERRIIEADLISLKHNNDSDTKKTIIKRKSNTENINKNRIEQRDDYQIIAELDPNTLNYTDASLTPNAEYEYRIKSHSDYNESDYIVSNIIDITFPPPTELVIAQDDVHTFTIEWNCQAEGEEGFAIYRQIDDSGYN